ncbi:hypothetical protein BD770DRAFT_399702 [Pilaira anomala]|nr:hypothetical protein BD770DRAFT_399702 [Pilaira anomala]
MLEENKRAAAAAAAANDQVTETVIPNSTTIPTTTTTTTTTTTPISSPTSDSPANYASPTSTNSYGFLAETQYQKSFQEQHLENLKRNPARREMFEVNRAGTGIIDFPLESKLLTADTVETITDLKRNIYPEVSDGLPIFVDSSGSGSVSGSGSGSGSVGSGSSNRSTIKDDDGKDTSSQSTRRYSSSSNGSRGSTTVRITHRRYRLRSQTRASASFRSVSSTSSESTANTTNTHIESNTDDEGFSIPN